VCRRATIARLLAITAKCVSPFTDIKKEVEAVIAGIGDPVLEDHYFYMRVQKAKLRGML
jgi:hypothetical protein